ncbi:hypothetical protein DL762_007220 [Monosporascus cannonballus]|uniref:Uncharacterized protein n=1 Tax=Monosporascus cannonballus TaxID=155416 RepID=A0ABY0H085_9PEZI|nr:hypothetical protein DL762_007220 [Monosporascus cannonballus]
MPSTKTSPSLLHPVPLCHSLQTKAELACAALPSPSPPPSLADGTATATTEMSHPPYPRTMSALLMRGSQRIRKGEHGGVGPNNQQVGGEDVPAAHLIPLVRERPHLQDRLPGYGG